jgi:sugar phosphate isomerase/epimerase
MTDMSFQISRRVFLATLPLPVILLETVAESTISVGCQTNAWPLKAGDFPALLDVLGNAGDLGYTGFECNIRFVQDQFGRTGQARQEIARTGMRFVGAHTSMQQATPESFPKNVAGVAALGAERLVMSGTGLSPTGQFEIHSAEKKASDLNDLGRESLRGGLKIAYHNHNPEFANHNAEIDALARYTSPELVDFLVDAGHGYLGGGDPAAFMTRHSTRIFGLHVKTFKGADQQVPLGEGDFGFEALAAAIKQTRWTGWIMPEEGGNARYSNSAALGPDRAYVRRVFGA